MSEEESFAQVRGLDQLIKALGTPPTIRVGILGDHAARNDSSGLTNAQLGAIHEFGTSTQPARSFLRLPTEVILPKMLGPNYGFSKEVWQACLKLGSFMPWADRVGIAAVDAVLGAFDSEGYGTWVRSNMAAKKNQQTLVESGQLRDSISYDVVPAPPGSQRSEEQPAGEQLNALDAMRIKRAQEKRERKAEKLARTGL